jgi:hypothetical protein
MNICSWRKSVQSGDDVVRNKDGQGRSALVGCDMKAHAARKHSA